MSRFSGPQGKGAARRHREAKRAAAETRNAATPPERRAAYNRPCPTGKHKYRTEAVAKAELVGAFVDRNRGQNHRHECRIYLCPMCKWWHLTSHPYRGKAKAKQVTAA